MKTYKKILIAVFCIIYITGIVYSPAMAWEMQGNTNLVTGSFNHDFIASQALKILYNDWYGAVDSEKIELGLGQDFSDNSLKEYFDTLTEYKDDLEKGSRDADNNTLENSDFIYSSHFYDPDTGKIITWYTPKENLTAEFQAKRFIGMAVATFKEAEESEKESIALTEKAENNVKNAGITDIINAVGKYKAAILKSEIINSKENINTLKNNIVKSKEGIANFTNGLASAKQLAEYEFANDQAQCAASDVKSAETKYAAASSQLADAEQKYNTAREEYQKSKVQNETSDVQAKKNQILLECGENYDKAKETFQISEKRYNRIKNEAVKAPVYLSNEDKQQAEQQKNILIKLLEYEQAASEYEKAVALYQSFKAENGYQKDNMTDQEVPGKILSIKSSLDNNVQRIEQYTKSSSSKKITDEDNDIVKKITGDYERICSLQAIVDARTKIDSIDKSALDGYSNYKNAIYNYVEEVNKYEQAVRNYNANDIAAYKSNIDNLSNLTSDDTKRIYAFNKAVESYNKAKEKYKFAVYCLGYACHFFVDICNPHHATANAVPFPPYNHYPFEIYAQKNQHKYAVESAKDVEDRVLNNKYNGSIIDSLYCYKMSKYDDLASCLDIYSFIDKESKIMGGNAKDYFYERNINTDYITAKLLGASFPGALEVGKLSRDVEGIMSNARTQKEIEDINARWNDAAEKTVSVSQTVAAKFYLEFLKELRDSGKFTLVAKTSDELSAGSTDNLCLYVKGTGGEKTIYLDSSNDIIEECLHLGKNDGMRSGKTDTYNVYINKKLWNGSGAQNEVPQLTECKLMVKNSAYNPNDWICEDARVIYNDNYLIAESDSKKTLKASTANSELPLALVDGAKNKMNKVTVRFGNSNIQPSDIYFGLVYDNGFNNEFPLDNRFSGDFLPGQIDECNFYTPAGENGKNQIKSCWFERKNYLLGNWQCTFADVYQNGCPIGELYDENGFTVKNKKLYIMESQVLSVKIKTCNEWFAGTNDDIYFYLVDKSGNKVEFPNPLDKEWYNDFEKDDCDTYYIHLNAIEGISSMADIAKAGIEKKYSLISDDWKCDSVEVLYNDTFLAYERLNMKFDDTNLKHELNLLPKLYVTINGNNHDKLFDNDLSLVLKTSDGTVKTFKNQGTGNEVHEFNIVDENNLPLNLRSFREVWLEKGANSTLDSNVYMEVKMFDDSKLQGLLACHYLSGSNISEHWQVNGLIPSDGVNVKLEFITEENYETTSVTSYPTFDGVHCPTYFVLETDIKQHDDQNIKAEYRCSPKINSQTKVGSSRKYIKTYTAEFKIKNPEFLASNINAIKLEKRNNSSNAMMPSPWNCTSLTVTINGYNVTLTGTGNVETGTNYSKYTVDINPQEI